MKSWPTHIVSAGGVVLNREGEVLLGKHPRRGWDFTGGQVENGENLEEAVLREIREESGVTAALRCLVGVYSNVRPICEKGTTMPTILHVLFLCDYVSGTPAPSEEALEVLWVPPAAVLDYVETPVSRLKYAHVRDFDGRVRYIAYVRDPAFEVVLDRYI